MCECECEYVCVECMLKTIKKKLLLPLEKLFAIEESNHICQNANSDHRKSKNWLIKHLGTWHKFQRI